MQNGMIERNADLPPERRIEFRVGIHLGDVVEESDGDLMGDSVNIAARLEGIADPGGICLANPVWGRGGGGGRERGRELLSRSARGDRCRCRAARGARLERGLVHRVNPGLITKCAEQRRCG